MEKSPSQWTLYFTRAWVRILTGLFFSLGLTSAAEAGLLPSDCDPPAISLESLVTCIVAHMPLAQGANDPPGFVVPPQAIQDDWRGVVFEMLSKPCGDVNFPQSLMDASYSIFPYADAGTQYCVLMENTTNNAGKVSQGWGTVITNGSAKRQLSIQVPHPIADIDTYAEGIGIFKGAQAQSFIMAGTHRKANSDPSDCEPSFSGEDGKPLTNSDAGHNVATPFQWTVQALQEFYNSYVLYFSGGLEAIQFHGMESGIGSSCPDVNVYMTYGLNQPPAQGDRLQTLQSKLQAHHPGWMVTVPKEPGVPFCKLHGTNNVQGRLLNQSPDVCSIADAPSYSGRFIHIEQQPNYRKAGDWIAAIKETWPIVLPPVSHFVWILDQFHIWMLDLQSLVERGTLRPGPGNALMAKLRAATRQIERGRLGDAVHELTAFIDQVDALQRSGRLDATWAAYVVAQAEGAVAQLRGGQREPHPKPW